jgi:hypothetical protein
VKRTGNPRPCLLAVAATAACMVAIAGCGGGGGDGSSEATETGVQLQTPTAPNVPDEEPFRSGDRSTSTTPSEPSEPPPGVQRAQRALAPFQACLTRHGVDPTALRAGGWRQQERDPAQMRKAIEAGIACIPKLPPGLQAAAERFKRRYEQRQGGSG